MLNSGGNQPQHIHPAEFITILDLNHHERIHIKIVGKSFELFLSAMSGLSLNFSRESQDTKQVPMFSLWI
jgi:hypothetical protein